MAIAEVPFDLAEVKLAPPQSRPDTVAKADLIARLCASRSPVVTIVAPAGYGKTTLVARWAEADPRPFAWVALDGRDDDALMFLRYIAAAIHRVAPVPLEVFDALSGPGGSTWSNRVPRVGGALAALERPLVLVLDDVHAVANPSCLDVLAALVGFLPAGSQIAIASREEPALPLARWRARGLTDEIGVADLRLDEQEAESLLAAAGVRLEPSELSELTERTEGWPAGLYLAALSLQAGGSSSASAAGFTGDDRFVSEYFRFELLSRLPLAEARFLQYSSVLDRMCGGLCDAVLQTPRSAQTLETLERTNGFVVPLDRRGEWYRYHHLFGELLRNELERSEPEMVPALNRRAMDWCIANDLTEAAIVYGRAAGETDTVAGLFDALLLPLYYDGRKETVEQWLGWFDDDELVRYPALAVYGAWLRAMTGRPAEAERWLALADGATSAIPLSDGCATIEPWVATLRAHMMPDGVEQGLADAELALNQLPPTSQWVPTALLGRGVSHALLGATERAKDDLTAAIERAEAVGAIEELYLAHAQLALMAAKDGAWAEAATAPGGAGPRRRGGARRLLDQRDRARRDGTRRTPRRAKRGRPHGADPRAPSAAAARPRHSVAHRPGRARAGARASHPRRGRAGPHDPQRGRARARAPPAPRHPRRGGARAARPRGGDLRVGRRVGDEPDGRGDPAAAVPRHPSHVPRDRDPAVHLAQHGQDRGGGHLPQARRRIAQRRHRARRRARAPGELVYPPSANLTLDG